MLWVRYAGIFLYWGQVVITEAMMQVLLFLMVRGEWKALPVKSVKTQLMHDDLTISEDEPVKVRFKLFHLQKVNTLCLKSLKNP